MVVKAGFQGSLTFLFRFYFSLFFLENALLSLLFTLKCHLRYINPEFFPRLLRSLGFINY